MKKRGEINIGIANYLYSNSKNILTNSNNNNLNSDNIKHIIIGRWYYGLYLIAKNYLIENNVCTDDISNFHHKTNENAHIYSIWHRIGMKLKSYNDIIQGEELARLREYYEYSGILCQQIDFDNAERIFNEIYEIFRDFDLL
ncbi:hypothetical protein R4J17_15000 [Brachyspira intermedia]|uniref:hypothetical protein n=1 Tax=Brachyspira intermedia TaxID=84377 RepID=UPI003005DBDB